MIIVEQQRTKEAFILNGINVSKDDYDFSFMDNYNY